jgi:subtilisin family serine protease
MALHRRRRGAAIVLAAALLAIACASTPAIAAPPTGQAAKLVILRTRGGQLERVLGRLQLTLIERLAWDPTGDDVALVRLESGPGSELDPLLLPVVDPGIRSAEAAATAKLPESASDADLVQSTMAVLDALGQGGTAALGTGADGALREVWGGYARQPAANRVRLEEAHQLATGRGAIVAIIDTGIDPVDPLFADQLLAGWDFVEERSGASERGAVRHSAMAVLEQSTMAVLDRSTRALVAAAEPVAVSTSTTALLAPGSQEALDAEALPVAFGHGTMVAGVVHLVAPDARIMPLRAFDASGAAGTFDLVQAIYHAVRNGATVLNLSFSLDSYSRELDRAIRYATRQGLIAVAAAGNDGAALLNYPAALPSTLGVAATDDHDEVAAFSSFGSQLVTLAAPGVSVITTYPGGGWAAASGTSFATPFVSGTVALLSERAGAGGLELEDALAALSHAAPVSGVLATSVGFGRLDVAGATEALTVVPAAQARGSDDGAD